MNFKKKNILFLQKKIKNNYNINLFFINNIYFKKKINKIKKFIYVKINKHFNKYTINIKNILFKKKKINLKLNFMFLNYVNLFSKLKLSFIIDKNLYINIKENYIFYNIYNLFFNYLKLKFKINNYSKIKYLKFKNKKINCLNKINIYQKKFSIFKIYDINLYENKSLNVIKIYNLNNNCKNYIFGIYITNKNQYINNLIIINNKYNNCINKQNYIGIYIDKSIINLKGIININRNTKKNISIQNYKNFILSNKVYINFKPYLNILSNNVKCSHGVNIGILDKDIIFYLQTRGLNMLYSKLLYFLSILKNNILNKKIKKKIINKLKNILK
ncbi:MAG: SufD family Fe-S cluster assembly protein [Candidatus Shikimatogenerans sp. JK-2022]|nr:SufD family Fe-S cluster assembly protein [Candidatus Shikimatogenerans bostrichidophilus]